MSNKEKVKTEIVAAVEMLDQLHASIESQETLNADEVKVVRDAIEPVREKFRLQTEIASVESLMVEKERLLKTIGGMTTALESRVDKLNFL